MSGFLERKYVNLLSSHLRNFKRKGGNVFNFSCPICGDSKKSPRKARGFVYKRGDTYFYTCHNECGSMLASTLLEKVSPLLYKEYVKELMIEKYQPKDRVEEFEKQMSPAPVFTETFDQLETVLELSKKHHCKKYVEERRLPESWYNRLYYAPKFMTWVNTMIPKKFSDDALKHDEERLVLPFYTKDKKIFGFTGRSLNKELDKSGMKYLTIILDPSHPKIFGLDTVDTDRKYYVFEGPFDSLFIPNSVAGAGGDIWSVVDHLNRKNAVLVFDNEPRGKDTIKRMKKAINQDLAVCIWPDHIYEKDVNEMIMNNTDAGAIKRIIDSNTYKGMSAQLQFQQWMKR